MPPVWITEETYEALDRLTRARGELPCDTVDYLMTLAAEAEAAAAEDAP